MCYEDMGKITAMFVEIFTVRKIGYPLWVLDRSVMR